MRLALRSEVPEGVTIEIEPACDLPPDWYRWRDTLLGGAALAPIVEGYTDPEGWSVTIAEVATAGGPRTHAFYAIFDRAVHATAALPADAGDELRARVRTVLAGAGPIWPDAIVALEDLL